MVHADLFDLAEGPTQTAAALATAPCGSKTARRVLPFLLKVLPVSTLPEASFLGSYQAIVRAFLEKGYAVHDFHTCGALTGELVLRHDVDFDCHAAKRIAEQETQLGVRSTFFFLLRSASYNLLEPTNLNCVKAIRDLGHEVSVHYDATLYADASVPPGPTAGLAGLVDEAALFERIAGVKVRIVSFHRPTPAFSALREPFAGIAHTYQPKFTKDMAYLSDSQGAFRYGHPLESEAFKTMRSVQLLTHPIWWALDGADNIDVLERFLKERTRQAREHVGRNCIPFQKHVEPG
jgi:hypothetical protein